ncbi:hypothetical protein A2U01_0083264, partial [Trifolium medium]|nr:hypothetical protein [Trifolium medium]
TQPPPLYRSRRGATPDVVTF